MSITPHPPESAGERPTRIRWLIFVLACLASWLLYVHRYSWGVIKPRIKEEYQLDDATLGWLDFAFQPTYGLFQVPGGLVGDLYGTHLVLTGSIVGWSLTVGLLALASGFSSFFMVRLLFGGTQAAAYPSLTKATRNWFPLRQRTTVQGVIIAMGRLGGACAPPIVATLLMGVLLLSWEHAMLVMAVPGVALGLAFWLLYANSPREHRWCNAAEQEAVQEGEAAAPAGARARLDLGGGNQLHVVLMLGAGFFSTFADQFYVFWVPSFLNERGMKLEAMGLFGMLPLLGGTLGAPVGGLLNDWLLRRTGRRRLVRSGIAVAGKSLAAGLTLVIILLADPRLAAVVLFAVKFFTDWSLASQWGAITDMGGKGAASFFAAVNTAGTIGAAIASVSMGYVKQYADWPGLFLLVAAIYLATALCWVFIDCTRRLVVETPAE